LCSFKTGTRPERAKIWGDKTALTKAADVYAVFERYIDGEVPRLPWCESAIQLETLPIKKFLKKMNHNGWLTINSQPRVNGEPSSDPAVGWGAPDGYVYQKAYLEFFTTQQNFEKLIRVAQDQPRLTYTGVNVKGKSVTNCKSSQSVNAVTWGVFPGREIIQPTVVDSSLFVSVWKDEAFALWLSQWQAVYDAGSPSFQTIADVHDNYFLVNIVDNDFIKGDIFAFMERVIG